MSFYQSRLEVACWKERTCVHCDCQYRYRLKATRAGKGATTDSADEAAAAAVVAALQKQVDLSPCPHCGNYQPEMIGALRLKWHAILMIADVAWLIPLAVAYQGAMPRSAAIAVTAVLALMMLLAHLFVNWLYPGNRAKANKALAARLIKRDQVRVVANSGKKPEEWHTPASLHAGPVLWLTFAIALGSLTLFAASDLLIRLEGWPANPAWHPEVVGPGDHAWVYLPRTIDSVKGYWTANVDATLEPLDAPDIFIPVKATSQNSNWGDRIEVKGSEGNTHSRLWVKIQVPKDQRLEGKQVRVHVTLNVAYPFMGVQRNHFDVREEAVQHTEIIHLAPANAGATFTSAWYASMLTPLFFMLMMQLFCLLRAVQMKLSAAPATVESCFKPRGKNDLDDDDEEWRPPPKKGTGIEPD